MKQKDEQYRTEVALFRYSVIADVLHSDSQSKPLSALLQEKSRRRYTIPGSKRTRIAAKTMQDWIRTYRRNPSLESLMPKLRIDRGRPRRMSVEMVEALLAEKRRNAGVTVKDAILNVRKQLQLGDEVPMPPSTVHRLFEREGLMKDKKATPVQDLRRFCFENAGDLWMGDVMHGIYVKDGAKSRKTYMISLIDDATRVIPYSAFAFSESTASFLEVFKQAIMRRGIPLRLYVDNGSCFITPVLATMCAKLDIALIHARPYHPAGKGKIERYHRTCRARFVQHLGVDDKASLEALNRKLRAWVEGEYHRTPHRGLDGITPLDQWAQCAHKVRLADAHLNLNDLFLWEAKRRVYNDRTVRLNNRIYEVPAHLVGQSVTLRHDPQAPASRPIEVVFEGEKSLATPLDAKANAYVKRQCPKIRFNDFPQQED